MDSSHVKNSQPQPSVELLRPLDRPVGWAPCLREDNEGIRAYKPSLGFSGLVILMNIFGIKQPQSSPAARALQGWYPRSRITGIGRYNEEGPSVDSWDSRDLTPVQPQTHEPSSNSTKGI
ncbi:hypothetical protein HZ326_19030 [Fusarium oxysporum f. sp. albedinis]|nr:hypothetical protein HZ326_19030 [Fusarium oxysporum f. sp. albedinis]